MSREDIDRIISAYPKEMEYALAIMQDMQHKFGCVPREGMEMVSAYLGCPLSHLYAMVTFYKALSLKPKGKYIIKVCDGTACHIRKSVDMAEEISEILSIRPGETTEDGIFSLEMVNCLGTCALAPVMLIGNRYYGKLTKKRIKTILEYYRNLEEEK